MKISGLTPFRRSVGDRIGRKAVAGVSILGVAPFALALPCANLSWCAILSAIIGLILASAFLVYAQELVPGKVGTMSGLFFGLDAAVIQGTALSRPPIFKTAVCKPPLLVAHPAFG